LDLFCQKFHENAFYEQFSIRRNFKKLFDSEDIENQQTIPCLDFLKSISLLLLIFAHCFISPVVVDSMKSGTDYFPKIINLNRFVILNCIYFPVEILFIINGFLTAQSLERKSNSSILKLFLLRLMRLTPVVAFAMLIVMTFNYISMDKCNEVCEICHQNWLWTLMHFQNLKNVKQMVSQNY
jgi:hypothetical protein